jgi:glycosyltransferase involved in cell wall biosynthesis
MKICFVAPNIYPWLSNKSTTKASGGAELQQVFIGKGLKKIGYDVSYISLDYGQPDKESIDSLEIYKAFKPEEGLFGVRFFYPRLYKIWKALKRTDADLYYVRTATFLPGIVSIFCKIYGKKFVYASANISDFIPKMFRHPTVRDKMLYKYGLRTANTIIVQSEEQKRLLWENFRLNCRIIKNFYPYKSARPADIQNKFILWVATMRPWKRPSYFVKIAQAFPNETFVMIGKPGSAGNDNLFKKIQKRAQNIPNLKFLGPQPLSVTESYFDRCKIFISTSEFEGFPNTFLQAWSRGVPVISYVDPDSVIKDKHLGFVVQTQKELHETLNTFLKNPQIDRESILFYFKQNHSSRVINDYDQLINGLRK